MRKNHDYVAESISEYMAMEPTEQGALVARVMEDQPYLMGFLTDIADEFSDDQHEILVDSVMILLNAFVSAGMPVSSVPGPALHEVIEERTEAYQNADPLLPEASDNPKVFQDLRNLAIVKADLNVDDPLALSNYNVVLDILITAIERMADYDQQQKKTKE
jgi:hypothetical protein